MVPFFVLVKMVAPALKTEKQNVSNFRIIKNKRTVSCLYLYIYILATKAHARKSKYI